MNRILSASQALQVLDMLKATAEEFAGRSTQQEGDFRQQTAREQQRRQTVVEQQNRRLTTLLAEAEADWDASKTAAQRHFEARRDLIARAYQSSNAQNIARIDDQFGATRFELQRRMLQAEHSRDGAQAAARKRHEEFEAVLTPESEKLAELEGRLQTVLQSYPRLKRRFLTAYEKVCVDISPDEDRLLVQLRESLSTVQARLAAFNGLGLLQLFRFWLFWGLPLACLPFVSTQVSGSGRLPHLSPLQAGAAALAILVGLFLVRLLLGRILRRSTDSLSQILAQARHLNDASREKADQRFQQDQAQAAAHYQQTATQVDSDLKAANTKAGQARVAVRMKNDQRTVALNTRNESNFQKRLRVLEQLHDRTLERHRAGATAVIEAQTHSTEQKLRELTTEHAATWLSLEQEWKTRIEPLYEALETSRQQVETLFPKWEAPGWKEWTAPQQLAEAAPFGHLEVNLQQLCQTLPTDQRLAFPGCARFALPLCIGYPDQGSVLFETAETGHDQAIGALNNLMLRLLATALPGRLNFTILDPVGLGQNFAGIMHLADFEDRLINSRIWTQSGQIEEKLADLNEHMEKVIQMYLRNEYASIAEYNQQAGVIAEKYHFLVIADFPSNFSDLAIKRLLSIAASGARCGVYLLMHWDKRQAAPAEFLPSDLRKNCTCLSAQGERFVLTGRPMSGLTLTLDSAPAPEFAIELIQQIGRASRDSSRVEVPFAQIRPSETDFWSEDTTQELRVPIGRTGATKLQYLSLGKGTCQHGLVAGKTGSGKSTLFHVLITNLALWCSPEQVEFYLVDFKKGVEFKCYAARHLPHARVVAIESDREFGLSVLQRVDEELKRRGDLFRRLGAQDLPGYKKAGGREPMPRCLLLIDEFQEFFVEDDKLAQTASLLLDRIVRQGRAFGIHVLLGSQTLGGAYTVARTTLGQMVVRVALQCNEADAMLIMDENNPAPRLLSRPGEGIYNDQAGTLEGNSPFQVVWLPDEERDGYLAQVRARADQIPGKWSAPLVFEGNAPADVRENQLLRHCLELPAPAPAAAARFWLGAPNAIKGPTEVLLQAQSGNNLLLVGQRDEATLAMLSLALLALAAQYRPEQARILFCEGSAPDSPERQYIEALAHALPFPITLAKPGDVLDLMAEMAAEQKKRAEMADPERAPRIFLFVHGIQKFTRLRYEEDYSFSSSSDADGASNPAAVLNNLVCEGPRQGIHCIISCDGFNNVTRYLGRKALSEFEMRVLFQMSANDSASLIDNPRASVLGLNRALFYNAQEGSLETFRPYALPAREWIEQSARLLAQRSPVAAA